MKKLFLSLAGVAIILTVYATQFPIGMQNNTVNAVLASPSVLQTNLAGIGVFVESASLHTIHVVNTGTNTAFVGIDRSLDGSNWIIASTNTVAAGAVGETTMTGKWSYVRARCYSTNTTLTVNYLGGR